MSSNIGMATANTSMSSHHVVFIHGWAQNRHVMMSRTQTLTRKLQRELHQCYFLQAPHLLPPPSVRPQIPTSRGRRKQAPFPTPRSVEAPTADKFSRERATWKLPAQRPYLRRRHKRSRKCSQSQSRSKQHSDLKKRDHDLMPEHGSSTMQMIQPMKARVREAPPHRIMDLTNPSVMSNWSSRESYSWHAETNTETSRPRTRMNQDTAWLVSRRARFCCTSSLRSYTGAMKEPMDEQRDQQCHLANLLSRRHQRQGERQLRNQPQNQAGIMLAVTVAVAVAIMLTFTQPTTPRGCTSVA